MKIVYRVGEWLLPHWIRAELRSVLSFTGTGRALADGSRLLARRGWTMLGEHLDRWERYGAVAATGYAAGFACWHAPDVARFAIPGTVVAWCVAAWWMAPPVEAEAPAETAVEEQPASSTHDVYAATLDWIRQRIGDRQGVHLRDLLEHAQAHGMFEALDVTELRAHLERHGFPVRDRVRVRGLGVTVGVYRADLPPLPEPLPDPDGQDPPDSELHPV